MTSPDSPPESAEPSRAPADAVHVEDRPVLESQPGTAWMPKWTVAELPAAPKFQWSRLAMMIGPGLVMGGAAIGGGEWLTGPLVTARYGGALLWLATLSIVFQVIYNVEISRYTLYCGEPILTGKFRIALHPMFWLGIYLLLDLGSVLPYLASNAAIPLAAMIKGTIPSATDKAVHDVFTLGSLTWAATDSVLLKVLSVGLFVLVCIPLCVGGKVYNSIKAMMTVKLVLVLGFLLYLAFAYSTRETWLSIGKGFVSFGNVPVVPQEDTNGNGIRDNGEAEHGPNVENLGSALFSGRSVAFDWSMLAFLASMVAISGNGGLTNTPISSFTRDQGWGMGRHVGAIPSVVGGHEITLSHSGTVFRITSDALKRWWGWVAHVQREQYLVWLPACIVGVALPSMLSVQFLPPRTVLSDKWQAASMTAEGVQTAVALRNGATAGEWFWYMTQFCGLLILVTSLVSTADGVLRRWVDVFWTSSPRLRKWDTRHIGRLYFGTLCLYLLLGVTMLLLVRGDTLLTTATGMMYNYALGVSCLHTLVVNTVLLPVELRPRLWQRVALVLGCVFFITIGVLATMAEWPKLKGQFDSMFGTPAAQKAA